MLVSGQGPDVDAATRMVTRCQARKFLGQLSSCAGTVMPINLRTCHTEGSPRLLLRQDGTRGRGNKT
jgi:hypothetical protein